jgi:hypothetical protein
LYNVIVNRRRTETNSIRSLSLWCIKVCFHKILSSIVCAFPQHR